MEVRALLGRCARMSVTVCRLLPVLLCLMAAGSALGVSDHPDPEKLALHCDLGIMATGAEPRRVRAVVALTIDVDVSPQLRNGARMANIEIRSASPLLPFDPIRDWFTGSNREVGEWIGDEFKIIAPHRNPPVELRINRRTGVLVYNSVRVDERLRTTVIAAQGECRRADGRRHL